MKNSITFFILFLFTTFGFAQKSVRASDIMRNIKAGNTIEFSNVTIEGVLDFTFMDEAIGKLPKRNRWWKDNNSNAVEKQITQSILFNNCVFKDDVLAYIPHEKSGYTFVANFENDVIFKNCTFEQKAMFKYSNFLRNTDFSDAKFNNDTTFKYANFERNITFKNTIFTELATFKYTDFKKFANFENALFKESTTFKYAKFNGGVTFNNTKFKGDLNIKYTTVTGEFNIQNMEVIFDIDAKYTSINGNSLSKYLLKNR